MEAGLNWRDFLPEDEDVNKFVTEQVSGGQWGLLLICCKYLLMKCLVGATQSDCAILRMDD